jgi:hypothetical protein
MTDAEIQHYLLLLCRPELEELIVRLGINPGFIEHNAPAARAAEVWTLAMRPGGVGIVGIRAALQKMNPSRNFDAAGHLATVREPESQTFVLVLTANPLDTSRLALGVEASEIKKAMSGAGRADLRVVVEAAARVEDISDLLARYQPTILHFSGHGTVDGALQFENDTGTVANLSVDVFGRILQQQPSKPRCILLNACYTAVNASLLVSSTDFVVGMDRQIGDSDARAFTAGFYRALSVNQDDIPRAFRLGCDGIDVRQLPDALVPRLRSKDQEIARLPIPPAPSEAEGTKRSWINTRTFNLLTPDDDVYECPVWYGTNRQPIDTADEGAGYSGRRDMQMHYGKCVVTVPKAHRVGEDRPSSLRRVLSNKGQETTLRAHFSKRQGGLLERH